MPPPSPTAEQVGALPSHQGPGHAMLDPSPSFPPEGYDPRRIMAAIGVVGDKLEEHQVSTGGRGLQAIVADLLLKADRDGTPTEELESRIRSKGRAPRPWWLALAAISAPGATAAWISDLGGVRSAPGSLIAAPELSWQAGTALMLIVMLACALALLVPARAAYR